MWNATRQDFGKFKRQTKHSMLYRFLLLQMCLDVEHALKVPMLADIEDDAAEDGYQIVDDFLSENASAVSSITNTSGSSFSSGLIDKYFDISRTGGIRVMNDADCPVWVLTEVLTFGDFARLYNFYYQRCGKPDKQLDILIVVDQMLTGFDSKWVNTLYLDKLLKYENLIQAFSRTNRLFGPDKPFGTVRYYRKAHTMERNVEEAFNLYSGDKPYGLFAEKLEFNVDKMADIFKDIYILLNNAKIDDFTSLPKDKAERGQFAKLFKQLNQYLEAAKIQGFKWDEDYGDPDSDFVKYIPDEETYLVLAMRYKELFDNKEPDTDKNDDVPYEIDTYLTEIDTGRIDKEYMNSRFTKYLKLLQQDDVDEEELQRTLNELHKSFASLSQDEQKYANIFLHEVQSGDAVLNPDMTFRDYINEYMANAKNDEIHRCAELLGVDEGKLRAIMSCCVTESTLNEYGRFDDLVATVDKSKAKIYFEKLEGKPIPPPKVNPKASTLLREFVLSGGFEIDI